MRMSTSIPVLLTGLIAGCNAFDRPPPDGPVTRVVIPTDSRPVEQALTTPPPVSGGTLALSADGSFAVAADPDRDRISIVELDTNVVREIALSPGDEPGRVAVDPNGFAYVALRHAGDVVRIDVERAELVGRQRACAAPRGLAYDEAAGLVHVACASGELVSLDAGSLEPQRTLELDSDLRDVAVHGNELLVSRFKRAELLVVDDQGEIVQRDRAPSVQALVTRTMPVDEGPSGTGAELVGTIEQQNMDADLAWRTLVAADGSSTMLHQVASTEAIELDPDHAAAGGASSYGGSGGGCSGVVQSAITIRGADGSVRTSQLGGSVLAVDVAASPDGHSLAVAQAGMADPEAPRPSTVTIGPSGSNAAGSVRAGFGPGFGSVVVIDVNNMPPPSAGGAQAQGACDFSVPVPVDGQATAVAYRPSGELVVQTREPAALALVPAGSLGPRAQIALGGASVRDTGHEIFHRDAGGGIACASCHAEGGEDGHTWVFSDVGPRRTQALYAGLKGTAPFHWNGDQPDVATVMETVFVGRMGGVHQSDARLSALTDWLFALPRPAPMLPADDPAAMRGKALFESAEVGCATCHAGQKFTDNKNHAVGTTSTDEPLQVPSLRAVGYRAPFIHTGCAESLRDRFDPKCGGAEHGNTAQLDETQVDDLIAYLRSL